MDNVKCFRVILERLLYATIPTEKNYIYSSRVPYGMHMANKVILIGET